MSNSMDSAGKGRNLSTNFWIWALIISLLVFAGNTIWATTKSARLGGASTAASDLQVNSQATIGGRTYAATPDGLFLLEGDDDDGAPIVARLRKGWTSLGTQFKKQVANAYLGYTSDGQIRLKVSTTDNTNAEGHSVVYAVNKVAKRTIAENRIDMAKGRHSVYWDFEIGNVMGSDFELNVIKVWRLALNRRK